MDATNRRAKAYFFSFAANSGQGIPGPSLGETRLNQVLSSECEMVMVQCLSTEHCVDAEMGCIERCTLLVGTDQVGNVLESPSQVCQVSWKIVPARRENSNRVMRVQDPSRSESLCTPSGRVGWLELRQRATGREGRSAPRFVLLRSAHSSAPTASSD